MLYPGVKKLGKELEFKRTESEVAGTVKNCYVKLYDGQNMKVLELFAPEFGDSDREYIENKLKANKVKKHEWLENGVKIIFNEYFVPYSIAKIRDTLNDFADYFSAKYPHQKPRCQKCGLEKEVDAYTIDAGTIFICEDCCKSYEDEITETNLETKYAEPHYLSGFLGSLLYSIPGILVTILFFVFLDSLAAVSALLYVFLGINNPALKGRTLPCSGRYFAAGYVVLIRYCIRRENFPYRFIEQNEAPCIAVI